MRLPDILYFRLGPLYLQWGHRGPHDDKFSSSGGLGFLGGLTLLFIGLKLTGFINWSWWWVTAPLWAAAAAFAALGLLGLTGYLTFHACKIWQKKRAEKRWLEQQERRRY